MAEAVGLASGLLTLASFAFQSSITLYETVKSFNSHPKRVRDLLEELEALIAVLGPVKDMSITPAGTSLPALDLPLKRCGNACKEFEQQLVKCSSRSGGDRKSFRDWARLRYMNDDIDGFRRLLAGYKLTINIALTDATLHRSSVTAEMLENHKHLIQVTKDDLEAHLESMDERLERVLEQAAVGSKSDTSEMQEMKEERLSTERCLQICARLSEHIEQIQLSPERSDHSSGISDLNAVPEMIVNQGLQQCKDSLNSTAMKLEKHIQDVMDRMFAKSKSGMTSEEDIVDLTRLRDEWKTTRQCIDICSRADKHLKETVTTVENHGTGDSIQFMISTNGQVIHGKNRGLGWRNRQVGGHLSDDSLQQLSRDMTSIKFQQTYDPDSQSADSQRTPPVGQDSQTQAYSERYGRGYQLTPKSPLDNTSVSMIPSDSKPPSR
ncbi:hypothetical protein UA08_04514 [Talaromyces atroroseus]|uniref:Azaphilone pigments biosynthesis cluster protein L N-terminal domain-containing protein n=1 Tax=Talaromyces atroroseus TaxID=1441469 RepID=A0A225ALK0_TALAT|nr:hypothetical protein UA08_04514 [Talaromyces atroroseus]OKL60273.1 hypothetical protein UA08_04514 [Talaromyces atroroseus]